MNTKRRNFRFRKRSARCIYQWPSAEEYVATLEKNITRTTADFEVVDGETEPKVKDQERAVIGGMITGRTVKKQPVRIT